MPFSCDCLSCVPSTPYQFLSDLRRRLNRGLYKSGRNRAFDDTDHSAPLLETRSNRGIADRAQKQKTRLLNFCVAAEMYGLPDSSDAMASIILRMMRKFYYY